MIFLIKHLKQKSKINIDTNWSDELDIGTHAFY